MGLKEQYKKWQDVYHPGKGKVKVLFIAESPPKIKPNTLDDEIPYFYNDNEKVKNMNDFSGEMCKALKLDKECRLKEDFLRKFQDKGHLLIDIFSTRKELENFINKPKKQQREFIDKKKVELETKYKESKIIYITKRIFGDSAVPFPAHSKSNREKFRDEIRQILKI